MNGDGQLEIRFYTLDGTGDFDSSPFDSVTPVGDHAALAPLGTGGLMSAITDVNGNVRLDAWDVHRLSNMTRGSLVAERYTTPASSLDLCRIPGSTHAEGDYVTATKDSDGLLRLRAYRSGARPY
jgi:hypothetical protein